jgi:hypothetical protein
VAGRRNDREKLYEQIVTSAQEGLARYYMEFPERIGDARAREALDWSLRGVSRILRLLDEYDLVHRPPADPEQKPPEGAPDAQRSTTV